MVRVQVRSNLTPTFRQWQQMRDLGQLAAVSQAHADMEPYVPKLSGDLRSQSQITSDNKSVIYNAPYAAAHFYNTNGRFKNYTTPGTGPRWDLKAESIHKASWARVIEAAMRL